MIARFSLAICFSLLTAHCLLLIVSAQTATATLSGTVEDEHGAVIPGVSITVINLATSAQRQATTNGEGYFVIPLLPPSRYQVTAQNQGFTTVRIPEVVLNVGDQKALTISLKAGDVSATVQVVNEAPLINESPAVGTVIDQKYVANMPLNGRSFQDLILLTPGVVTNSPQGVNNASNGFGGEFSVNGQRTESNYYSVDGVSANVGTFAGDPRTAGTSGSGPLASALGTTQSLVSVDALQEFRVQSSTYSAEYGRNPGGQFSFVTRSGTNEWHGTAFEYLRNNVFDANNWFNNFFGRPKPALRQNDFGGTLGGPVLLPRFGEGGRQPGYDGHNRTFFFFSYEGLRLIQPHAADVSAVPDLGLRQSALSALQPVLNGFPLPNCTSTIPNCFNPGSGLAGFVGTWSDPSKLDATSIRLDHAVNDKHRLFFRFSDAPSNSSVRQTGTFFTPSLIRSTAFTSRSYTTGANSVFSSRVTNELRLNYTSNQVNSTLHMDSFGGANPINFAQLQGLDTGANPVYNITLGISVAGFVPGLQEGFQSGIQRQWNIVDTASLVFGRHQLKVGADYRRLRPFVSANNPSVTYLYSSSVQVQTNRPVTALGQTNAPAYPLYQNFSAFAQDMWQLKPRLTVSMGLRWEVNPAPSAASGMLPYTVRGTSLATLVLAPQGTPLWDTSWHNFAPRLGLAYVLKKSQSFETVVRGGVGVFYDTAQQAGSFGYFKGIGFTAQNTFSNAGVSFPLTNAQANPPLINPPVAPYGTVAIFAFPEHLQLPYTLQWNASVEQALGKSQALTVSYVASHGAKLLEQNQVNVKPFNPNFATINFFQNGLTSDYESLQLQFQRRLSRGLQALGSYTWSHSIDYGSNNSDLPYLRSNSDFDVRHNFSAAFSYELPNILHNRLSAILLQHWALDGRFTARTSFPVSLLGNTVLDPVTQTFFNSGLNLVPGKPIYISGAQCVAVYGLDCPGGRAINPQAFANPPSGQRGTAPRNFARGFGASQIDMAVRREFPIHERLKLQFRAEAFNIFNHPNFGTINRFFFQKTFGQATGTLNSGLGNLSPLYQMGGPRQIQFALKLMF